MSFCARIFAAAAFAIGLTFFNSCQRKTENSLNIYAWSEYVPQTVIDAFEKETGIKVVMQTFSSNEEMLAKLLVGGGRYDIIQPSDYVAEAMIKEGLLEPLNHAEIPNLKNLKPKFREMSFDPGNKFTVPWMAGTVGIIVNRDLVQDEIKEYSDVFQEKFRGKIVLIDDAREIVAMALSSMGLSPNDVTDENLAKARELLAQWLPLVKVFDSDSPKTHLLNGDVALGIVWSGEGALLLNESKNFEWILPAKGAHMYVDNLAVPKGAPNYENAMKFINFILRPDISKLISDEFPYYNPNLAARALLTEQQLSNPASFPTDTQLENLEIFRDIGEQGAKIDEIVTALKAEK
jgi:spermidine/putrescine transport system substrate-binding protein